MGNDVMPPKPLGIFDWWIGGLVDWGLGIMLGAVDALGDGGVAADALEDQHSFDGETA
jgi:hypothetical protein